MDLKHSSLKSWKVLHMPTLQDHPCPINISWTLRSESSWDVDCFESYIKWHERAETARTWIDFQSFWQEKLKLRKNTMVTVGQMGFGMNAAETGQVDKEFDIQMDQFGQAHLARQDTINSKLNFSCMCVSTRIYMPYILQTHTQGHTSTQVAFVNSPVSQKVTWLPKSRDMQNGNAGWNGMSIEIRCHHYWSTVSSA